MAIAKARKRSAASTQQATRPKRRQQCAKNGSKGITDDSSNGNSAVPNNPLACLNKLPEELLVNIVRHLRSCTCCGQHPDQVSISNLCLVNKRCNRIATEVLYESVVDPNNVRLMKRLANTALLTKHIKTLILSFGSGPVTRPVNSRVLQNACNLRKLAISETRKCGAKDLRWVNTFEKGVRLNQFAHLRVLSVYARGVSVEEISYIFQIPSLEDLQLRMCYQLASKSFTIPKSSSNIKALDLSNCFMDIKAAGEMISATKALQEFQFVYDTADWEPLSTKDNPMSQWPEHSWAVLGKALKKHKKSLEKLLLGDSSDSEIVRSLFPDGRKLGRLGSLRDFPNLTQIAAPLDTFLDVHLDKHDLSIYLPTALNHLEVRVQSLESVVACTAQAIGSLRKMQNLATLQLILMTAYPFREMCIAEPLFHLKASGVFVLVDYAILGREMKLDDIMEVEAGRGIATFEDEQLLIDHEEALWASEEED